MEAKLTSLTFPLHFCSFCSYKAKFWTIISVHFLIMFLILNLFFVESQHCNPAINHKKCHLNYKKNRLKPIFSTNKIKQNDKDQSNDSYGTGWWWTGRNRRYWTPTDKQWDWTEIMKDYHRFEDFDDKYSKALSRWFWKNSNGRETVLFLTNMQY